MSILEIELTPEMEQCLRKRAELRGLEANAYASSIVMRDLSRTDVADPSHHPFNVMQFYGTGQESLKDLDVQEYVASLRDEWDK